MRAKHSLEPVLAEQVVARIVRLRHAIAIQIKGLPGCQDQLTRLVRRLWPYAESEAMSVFDRLGFAAVDVIRRVVAGIAIKDLPGFRRQHAEEQRHEHHIVVVLAKLAIDASDDVRGRSSGSLPFAHQLGRDADEAFRTRHEQRRGHPLAGDVADKETKRSVLGGEEIVEVTTDLARRMNEAPYIHRTLSRRQRKHLRQHAHLQIAGRLQLLLEPEQMGIDLVVQPLPFQAGAEARLQQHLIEGLEQIIDRTELDAAYDAGHLVERRDHDDGQVVQAPLILQPAQHLIAVDLRHHHVEQDDVEAFLVQPRDRLLSVLGDLDIGVALQLEIERERVAVVVVVVDDEDAGAGASSRPSYPPRCRPVKGPHGRPGPRFTRRSGARSRIAGRGLPADVAAADPRVLASPPLISSRHAVPGLLRKSEDLINHRETARTFAESGHEWNSARLKSGSRLPRARVRAGL